jgi:hypothetical protein
MRDGSQAPIQGLGAYGSARVQSACGLISAPLLASRRIGYGSSAAGGRAPCLLPEGPFVFWRS